jgi:hypothetical protein
LSGTNYSSSILEFYLNQSALGSASPLKCGLSLRQQVLTCHGQSSAAGEQIVDAGRKGGN